jgi:hypothetical protein
MPVSRSLSCAFIHVRKTAGTSIVRALEAADPRLYLNEVGMWDILCAYPERRNLLRRLRGFYLIGSAKGYPQWHLPAVIVRELIGRQKWKSLFTFAFVRNPWDLVVSAYHFEKRSVAQSPVLRTEPDRAEAIRRCPDFDRFVRIYPLLEPADMTSMIADDNGQSIVDFVGRFENLQTDFSAVCERIGLRDSGLSHENRSEDRRAYRDYYSKETRDIVARYFERDINLFGYEF